MKTLHEIIKILGEHKEKLREKYGITEIKLFGSYIKGEQNESSDIDIIVSFEEQPTLIELLKIEREFEKLLDLKVDLLTEEGISPFIKPYIKETIVV